MNPEIFCLSPGEWIGFEFIRTPQEVVRRPDVKKFKNLYRDGIVLPMPECYIHPITGDYVIMEGNHRTRAFQELLEEGHWYDYFYGNNAMAMLVKVLRNSRKPDNPRSLITIDKLRYI